MYVQWSAEDYEAMRRDARPRHYLEEALTIAKFMPGVCEVVGRFLPIPR